MGGLALIDVIIPNWNGRQYLAACLDSLRAQCFQSFIVTVVDNGSTDGSVEYLRDVYPQVKIIDLKVNKGFAGGVNAGINCTSNELIFLLNNDTELDPNCVRELNSAATRWPEINFFATKMLFRNNNGVINAVGDSFGVDGFARNTGIGEIDSGQYDGVREVFGACAGAALYRRSLFEDIGLFDEDFFLILEDVDLDFRAQLRGHRCHYVPTAVVYHVHSASIGKRNALQAFYTSRNGLYVLIKNMPATLLMKYFFRILRQRCRFAANCIVSDTTLPFVRGELSFFLTARTAAKKRFRVHLERRVATERIDSILMRPAGKG